MMMNAQRKAKSSSKRNETVVDLREFIAAGIQGVLLSRRFIPASEARQTGDESTLETARGLSTRFQTSITDRAREGADKVLAFMGEQQFKMASARSEFSRSLSAEFSNARQNGVRGDKAGIVVWAIKVYMDAQKAAKGAPAVESRNVVCEATRIVNLFAKATEAGLQHPKIRLQVESLGKVVFSLAGPRSSAPGSINITDGRPYGQNTYYGRITKDGQMVPSKACTDEVRDLIVSLATDPAGVAKVHGHRTGYCCFCGRLLTDDRNGFSVDMGYGPICSEKWGLPWGVSVSEEASA
jgi:hypothetical protein